MELMILIRLHIWFLFPASVFQIESFRPWYTRWHISMSDPTQAAEVSSFPVKTKVYRQSVQGIPTDFSFNSYADRVLLFVTQTGTSGTVIAARQVSSHRLQKLSHAGCYHMTARRREEQRSCADLHTACLLPREMLQRRFALVS